LFVYPSKFSGLRLEVSGQVDAQTWDKRVALLSGCPFHCYDWSVFSAESNRGRVLYFNWEDSKGECRALGFAIEQRICVFGLPVAGSLSMGSYPACANGIDALSLMEDVYTFAKTHGFAALQLNSFGTPWNCSFEMLPGFVGQKRWEFLIDLSPSLEDLWSKLHSKKRNLIRKAQKAGIKVSASRDLKDLISFREICLQTRDRKRAQGTEFPDVAPEQYFRLLHSRVVQTNVGWLYRAFAGDRFVAGSFFVTFAGTAYYLLSASTAEGLAVAAPDMILWSAIADFRATGCRTFNFGGLSESELEGQPLEESGLYHYKIRFATNVCSCCKGVVRLKPRLLDVISCLRKIKRLELPR
jgi:hypothetical protein